jgi:hypothetical protein
MSDFIDNFPRLRPLTTREELIALERSATADNHCVIAPTHLVVRGGDIVGYASLAGVPMLNVWVDSKLVRARESAYLLNAAENILAGSGHRKVLLPCSTDSRFHPLIEKLGYSRLGTTTLNLKGL